MAAIVAPSGEWDVTLANWPWPQVRFLNYYTIGLAIEAGDLIIYELSVDGDSWHATEMISLGTASEIGNVELVDYGMFYILSVYKPDSDLVKCYTRTAGIAAGATGDFENMDISKIPNFISGCVFNGQAVIGGIDSNDAKWSDLYRHSIAWSGIGTFDFQIDSEPTAGYAHTDEGQQGDGVLGKIRQLGNSIIAYTSMGVYQVAPLSAPAVGWTKPKNLDMLPPLHWNAVACSERVHYFIDINLDLWQLTADGVAKLSYKEFLQTLTQADIMLVYEEKFKRLYISDGRVSYVLTDKGLYQCHQCVTSIGVNRTELAGFFLDTEDYRATLVTNTVDFMSRGFKSIQGLELGYTCEDDLFAYINFASSGGNFVESAHKQITRDGFVAPIIAGVDMQLGFTTEDYRTADLYIDYINVKVKYVDKRFRRGSYATSENVT